MISYNKAVCLDTMLKEFKQDLRLSPRTNPGVAYSIIVEIVNKTGGEDWGNVVINDPSGDNTIGSELSAVSIPTDPDGNPLVGKAWKECGITTIPNPAGFNVWMPPRTRMEVRINCRAGNSGNKIVPQQVRAGNVGTYGTGDEMVQAVDWRVASSGPAPASVGGGITPPAMVAGTP